MHFEGGLSPGTYDYPFQFVWPSGFGTLISFTNAKAAIITNHLYLEVVDLDTNKVLGSAHFSIFMHQTLYVNPDKIEEETSFEI